MNRTEEVDTEFSLAAVTARDAEEATASEDGFSLVGVGPDGVLSRGGMRQVQP